jgi:hypothetical protein
VKFLGVDVGDEDYSPKNEMLQPMVSKEDADRRLTLEGDGHDGGRQWILLAEQPLRYGLEADFSFSKSEAELHWLV